MAVAESFQGSVLVQGWVGFGGYVRHVLVWFWGHVRHASGLGLVQSAACGGLGLGLEVSCAGRDSCVALLIRDGVGRALQEVYVWDWALLACGGTAACSRAGS